MQSPFAPGERVGARAQRWRVASTRDGRACVAITVDPLEGAPDATRTLIHPFDRFTRLRRHARLRTARLAHAYDVIAHVLGAAPDAWFTPRAVTGAAIDLLPHQFVAALALVRGVASRLCIMDAVGTGKTIQAGIAIAELLARGLAARVLVVVPAHLRRQWATELARLGIAARVLDAQGRDEAADALPADVSPWALPGTTIASLDLVKRRDTLVGLEDIHWDLVVVDEAHGATSHTDRHDAVDALARRADRVVLLTATPHDGDDTRYQRLLSLGGTDPLLVVRRTAARPARRIHRLAVAPSADETTAYALLDRYRSTVDRVAGGVRVATNRLVAEVLARRAASSMFALARTAARRREALLSPDVTQPLLFAADHRLLDDDGDDDAVIDAVVKAPGALDVRHERALLGAIHAAALRASRHDTLVHAIARIVRRAGEPLIVFAEYRDALVPLVTVLSRITLVEVLHGGCSATERAHALSAFTLGRAQVLLTTDTAAEGLNLHQRCRIVIHVDTPWTPTRIAQREGRVDRYGQARRVHAWSLQRRGHEQASLQARHQDRARAIDEALARHRDVPVLVTSFGSTPMPALLREAEHACQAMCDLRLSGRGRRAPADALASLRPRTRVVAVRRSALPTTLQGVGAIAVLRLVVSVSPAVSVTRQLLVALEPDVVARREDDLPRTPWRQRLVTLRPALEAYAERAEGETVAALVADEAHRRRAIDERARLVGEALRLPLASHFVQRELFATGTGPARPLRSADGPPRQPWLPVEPRVLVDVSLLLVPTDTIPRDDPHMPAAAP